MGSQKRRTSHGKKGGKVVIAAGAVIIVVLIAIIVVLLLNRNGRNENNNEPMRNVVVNEKNAENVAEEFMEQEQIRSGSYEVTMNSTWYFADGTSISENAYVENVANNTNDVYFDVNLADTDELIYSSPVIPLGSYLENIALDKDLEAGSYDCVLTYHLIDENQKTLSTLKVSLTVVIEK